MGFYVPDTLSDSFVTSKRNEEGSYAYEEQKNKVGLMEQKALQDLGESYSTSINNAYASYLANQRAILGSSMGEGFKQEYLQKQQESLMENVANANLSLAKARSEIEGEAESARSQIDTQRANEIEYLDRAIGSMENYMNYLDTATATTADNYGNNVTRTYLESATGLTQKEYKKFKVDEYYDILLSAQPQDYSVGGDSTNPAMSYYEWMRTQMKDTQADREFEKWFYGAGGYEELKEALATVPKAEGINSLSEYQKKIEGDLKNYTDIENILESANNLSTSDKKEYINKAREYRNNSDFESLSNLKHELMAKTAKIDQNTWKINGDIYKAATRNVLTRNDGMWQEINNSLSLWQKLDNREIFENDIVTYKDKTFVIGPHRSLILVKKQ